MKSLFLYSIFLIIFLILFIIGGIWIHLQNIEIKTDISSNSFANSFLSKNSVPEHRIIREYKQSILLKQDIEIKKFLIQFSMKGRL